MVILSNEAPPYHTVYASSPAWASTRVRRGGAHRLRGRLWQAASDRNGRQLSYDDLTQYQYVAAALAETIALMREIDEVIEAHDGWPLS